MESGDSFDFGSLVFSPIDEGLPFGPPASSPPPPPLLPNHTNGDLPQSAAAVDLQGWELPVFRSNPTPQELVLNHLAPAIDRLKLSKGGSRSLPSSPSVVNTGLPLMNPWGLPGISLQEGRREKYYLTDRHDLCFTNAFTNNNNLEAPDGFWSPIRGWVRGVKNETCSVPNFIGRKITHEFYGKGHLSGMGVRSKTNWIMDVYSLITEDGFIQDELVLCHVFEDDSPPYDCRPECLTFLESMVDARGYPPPPNRAINAPSNSSFISPPGLHSDIEVFKNHLLRDIEVFKNLLLDDIEVFKNLLLGNPVASTDTDNWNPIRDIPPIADDGHSRKRKKNRSDVWDYFTKIYARDRNGEVLTYAACNHCFKLMTGASSNGTAHLARHRCSCPCKLQPIAAGRNAQAAVNVLSS